MCDEVTTLSVVRYVTNSDDDHRKENIVTSSQSSQDEMTFSFSTNESVLLSRHASVGKQAPRSYTRTQLVGQLPEPTSLIRG